MGASAVVAVVSAVAGVASTISSMQEAKKQKRAARKQEQLQQKQIAEQQRQADISRRRRAAEQRRAARIKAARFGAQAGATGGGSVFTAAMASAQTAAQANIDYLNQVGESQARQSGIASDQVGVQADLAVSRANARISSSLANMVGYASQGAAAGYDAYQQSRGVDLDEFAGGPETGIETGKWGR